MKKVKGTKLSEWQKRCTDGSEICAKCKDNRYLTVDHVVPVNILEQFALDRIELLYNYEKNFEIICRYCNAMKAGRLDPKNPKTYEVLATVMVQAKKEALG